MSPSPVLVAGAGPTGLVLACGLAAAGVPVRVVDAAAGPATTSRALGLQPRGVEVLDRTGALGDLPARGLPVRTVAVHVGGRPLARLAVGLPTRLGTRPGLLVSQADVEAALRGRFAELGGTVEWGCAVTGLEQDADGVDVRLGDGTTARAGWVAGCDGAHSRVRALTGTPFPGVPLAERFLLADVVAALPLPRDTVAVWLDGEEMVAAFPLPGQDVWRLMAPAPDAPDDLPGDAVAARLAGDLHRRAGVPADAVRTTLWTSAFRIHRRLADRYRTGRVLLAGDAAHIHSPFGGQGLNTGVGDAENLAWKLALVAAGRADPGLLDTYEAERRPVAEEVLASTTGVTLAVLGGSAAARLLRDHVLVPLMNRPQVQRMVAERSSQLRVGYRRGPLGGRGGVGDRVPDLGVRGGRLHGALGPDWAVVASEPALRAACAAAAAGLGGVTELEPERPVRDALLVRPDGHLAWRGTDPAALAAHLADRLHLREAPAVVG